MKTPDYTAMSEKELLTELLKSQKKDTRNEKISAIANVVLAVILLLAAIILIPRTVNALNRLEEVAAEAETLAAQASDTITLVNGAVTQASGAITQIETAMTDAQTTLEDAQAALDMGMLTLGKIDRAVDGINSLVDQNSSALTETMQKINNIDFASLNNSIKALYEVLEPIRKFFGVFS